MPEISAFSLQTALTPGLAAPLENAGVPAEPGGGAPSPSFDALLALQAATTQTATALLPESGKTLPDAANMVAAQSQTPLPQAMLMKAAAARPVPTRNGEADAPADALPEVPDETATSAAEVAPQPDIALFAAIFGAPDRLAPVVSEQPAAAPAATPSTALATAPGSASPPAAPTAIAAAIANSAQIELIPATPKGASPRVASSAVKASTPAAAQASEGEAPLTSASTVPSATQAERSVPAAAEADTQTATPGDSAPRKVAPAATETIKPQLAEAALPSAVITDAPLAVDAQPVATSTRSEAKAERIDFATLVDTLNRAREDASPRSINVAVTNTDFGRVSMRFDSTDAGLSVAMSAADPGFARAVNASSEAAATSADTRSQNQQSQGDARAMASDANAQRQQQSQQQSARPDSRFAASGQPTNRREDAAADKTGDSGIYA